MIWLVLLAMLFGYAIGWHSRRDGVEHYRRLYYFYWGKTLELTHERDRMREAIVHATAYIERIEGVVSEFQNDDYITIGEVS